MVLFDELGLAERSYTNPLKVLHSKLEYTGKEEGLSFIGVSNYSLDTAKINRAIVLSVLDLDQHLDDLIKTANNIVKSIDENQKLKNEKIFDIISGTYFAYKNELQIIKELVAYKQYVYENKKSLCTPNSDNNEQENESHKDESGKSKDKEKRNFETIKSDKQFKYYYKKENKIRKDFH